MHLNPSNRFQPPRWTEAASNAAVLTEPLKPTSQHSRGPALSVAFDKAVRLCVSFSRSVPFYQLCILGGSNQFPLDGAGGAAAFKGCYLSLGTQLKVSVNVCAKIREGLCDTVRHTGWWTRIDSRLCCSQHSPLTMWLQEGSSQQPSQPRCSLTTALLTYLNGLKCFDISEGPQSNLNPVKEVIPPMLIMLIFWKYICFKYAHIMCFCHFHCIFFLSLLPH